VRVECEVSAAVGYCTSIQSFCVLLTARKHRVLIFDSLGPKSLLIYFYKNTSIIYVDVRNARNVRNLPTTLEH
jgi:hypothetical protein